MLSIKAVKAACLSVALVLGTSALAETLTSTDDFGGGEFRWERGGGGMKYRFGVLFLDNVVHVCGVYATYGGRDKNRLGVEVLRQAELFYGSTRIKRDLTYFNRVSSQGWDDTLLGREAECRAVDLSTQGFDPSQLSIRIREGTYRIRR